LKSLLILASYGISKKMEGIGARDITGKFAKSFTGVVFPAFG
jgi:hypothetical protein